MSPVYFFAFGLIFVGFFKFLIASGDRNKKEQEIAMLSQKLEKLDRNISLLNDRWKP